MQIQNSLYTAEGTIVNVLDLYIKELISAKQQEYRERATKLKSYQILLKDEIFLKELRDLFEDTYDFIIQNHPSLRFEMEGRLKSLISTDNKISYYQSVGRPLDQINDFVAFRIILKGLRNSINLIEHCYKLAEEIIDFFIQKGFNICTPTKLIDSHRKPQNAFNKNFKYRNFVKDYICFPKRNQYQSLHILFVNAEGKKFEIQIRDFEMHSISEFITANHAEYKKTRYGDYGIKLDRGKIKLDGYYFYSRNDQIINFLTPILEEEMLKKVKSIFSSSHTNDNDLDQLFSLLGELLDVGTLSKIKKEIKNFKDIILDKACIEHPLIILSKQKTF